MSKHHQTISNSIGAFQTVSIISHMASRKWHEEMKKDEVIHHFRPESFDVQVKVLNSKGQSGAMDMQVP